MPYTCSGFFLIYYFLISKILHPPKELTHHTCPHPLHTAACPSQPWSTSSQSITDSLHTALAIPSRYVSRVNVRDSTKHMILGTQQFRPMEFANQINLSMDNAWGILRCIIDICMKLPDGKYLIMKDPNKVTFQPFSAYNFLDNLNAYIDKPIFPEPYSHA